MKKVLVLCMGFMLCVSMGYADDKVEAIDLPSLNLPDLQAGIIYSATSEDFDTAMTATLLAYPTKFGDVELRGGYAFDSQAPLAALCFKLGDLTQYGFKMPLHQILNVSVGPYIAYNSQDDAEKEIDYGVICTVIQVSF